MSASAENSSVINSNVKNKLEVLHSPTKSLSDRKEYKVIRLENGLTACLISDMANYNTKDDTDEVKLAAAALCVGVGHFSNPEEVPGLAHFLEHMVSMGSEKYPEENDFDAFIKKQGGSTDASTDYDMTTFYFECLEKHLYQAMDKFAQFFVSPLLKIESMTREREAVESEFQMKVMSDDSRKHQLFVSLANESSPVNRFFCGNLIALRDNIPDDQLYEKLHKFRKRHYSAHRMTLAVQARLPMEILESYVTNSFSTIPNNGLLPDEFQQAGGIFDPLKFNRLYYIKPVEDICAITLSWITPSLQHLYRSKPNVYISQLLGSKGKGSLFSYLKKKVWVLSLYAGNENFNSIYASVDVTMVLTKEGFAHLKEVIEAVFSYLQMLKSLGPNERYFKEIQHIAEIAFRFEKDEFACNRVQSLSENMHYYSPEDYLSGSQLLFEYNPEAIEMILNHMVPDKTNVMILSSDLPDTLVYDKTEPWFKTKYTDIDIQPEWLNSWKIAEPLSALALPPPNPFLTEDFSLLPLESNIPDYPQKILDTPVIELWYRKDQKFELPVAYYYYYLITPLSLESSRSACMLRMLVVLLNINISEETYPADIAGLSFSIKPCDKGIELIITGYNEKLPVLIEMITRYFKTAGDSFTMEMFEAVKEKLTESVYNALLEPFLLCEDLCMNIVKNKYFSMVESHAAMSEITFEMMKSFSKDVLKCLHIQGLVQGNVTSDVALQTTRKLLEGLNCEVINPEHYPMIVTNEIPNGEHCCRVMSFNKDDVNSVIFNYYQCGSLSIKTKVILDLISLLTKEPLFDILRTKEQLGYTVGSTICNIHDVLGFIIIVNTQANKHSLEYVDTRIETFLNHVYTIMQKLTNEEFNQTKMDLIKTKQTADVDLKSEMNRNWEEITNQKYMFERHLQEIEAIEELNVEEVRKWLDKHICNDVFRKLSVQVVGYAKTEKLRKEATTDTEMDPCEEPNTETPGTQNKAMVEVHSELKLHIVEDKEEVIRHTRNENYFITNIDNFKKRLSTYPGSS